NCDHEGQSDSSIFFPIGLASGRPPFEFICEGVPILDRHVVSEKGGDLLWRPRVRVLSQHAVFRWRDGRRLDGECDTRCAYPEIWGRTVGHVVAALSKRRPEIQ